VIGTGRDLSVRGNVVGTARELSVRDINNQDDDKSAKMELNEFGIIVNNQLQWLENQYPYVVLHNYVVMPNHIHAIIEIDSLNIEGAARLRTARELSVLKDSIKIKSLSELMGAFKTTSSKLIHLAGYPDFQWQRSFHDHIIKDEKSYLNIFNYIETNPERWDEDKFYNIL
jgi:REP element-mobilizing transposase RayT